MTAQPSLLDILTPAATNHPNRPAPSWLLNHLITAGHVTETGISRRARIRTCRTCSTHTLVGLDNDRCAFEATVDPTPLSPLGEALAIVEGRRTLALHHEAGRYVLDPRAADHIADHPAGSRRREDVLREHRCDTAPPVDALTAPSTFLSAAACLPPGSPAPF
jgi:hypothetical protein